MPKAETTWAEVREAVAELKATMDKVEAQFAALKRPNPLEEFFRGVGGK